MRISPTLKALLPLAALSTANLYAEFVGVAQYGDIIHEDRFDTPASLQGWAGGLDSWLYINGVQEMEGRVSGDPSGVLTFNQPWQWPLDEAETLSIDFLQKGFISWPLDRDRPSRRDEAISYLILVVDNGTSDPSDDWGFWQRSSRAADRATYSPSGTQYWKTVQWNLRDRSYPGDNTFSGDAALWIGWGNVPAGRTVIDAMNQATQVKFSIDEPNPGPDRPAYPEVSVRIDNVVFRSRNDASLDFNGDGWADIVVRNQDTGTAVIHYYTDWRFRAGGLITSTVAPTWDLVGFGDFNSDGSPDIVYRDSSTGTSVIHYLKGRQFLSAQTINVTVPTTWDAVGVDDFNRDGKPDILYRNVSTGKAVIHYLDGAEFVAGGALTAEVSPGWGLDATGDFNKDGFVDVVYTNPSDGRSVIHYLHGRQFVAGGLVAYTRAQSEQVIGADDFDGDGFLDLVSWDPVTPRYPRYNPNLTSWIIVSYMKGREAAVNETAHRPENTSTIFNPVSWTPHM